MSDNEIIERAADVLINRATQFRNSRRIHFGIMVPNRNIPPKVQTTWQIKNMFGVTFPRKKIADARVWAIAALTAGYEPCIMFGKKASGFVPAEMLKLLGR
jgi:hypothetical protein